MHDRTALRLSAIDRAHLEKLAADGSSRRKHVRRARIVLLAADGLGTVEIMRQTGKSRPTVRQWQARFMSAGVDGLLHDRTRKPGKPPLAAETVDRVLCRTREPPPTGMPRWTGRMMAGEIGISLRAVQRIWQAHGLAPYRTSIPELVDKPHPIDDGRHADSEFAPLVPAKARIAGQAAPLQAYGDPRQKARLRKVAELAGVSSATVDHVLNERGNVRPETARLVIDASRQLRLQRTLPPLYRHGLRFEVLLTRPELPLIGRMSRAFAGIAASLDRSVILQRQVLEEDDPHQMARRLHATRCNGVIIYGQEHDAIRDAIATINGAGIPVVTLISDLPASSRLAYVGIDHYSAGRTGGFFLARMVREPGPVIVLCNHPTSHGHAERVRGLRDGIEQHGQGLAVVDVLEGHDASALSERLVLGALQRHPSAVGIYNAGAANRAVAVAIRRAQPKCEPLVFIGHELTTHTRKLLHDGTMTLTIDQNPEQQARFAVDVLLHKFGYLEHGLHNDAGLASVPFTLFGPENIGSVDGL
jgi:LacI family transcriptional regulator